jgi:predicted ester cyclase
MHTTTTTTTHNHEQSALRALELICLGDTGPAVDEVIHPDSVNHRGGGGMPRGPAGFRQIVRWINAAFADVSITPEDVIARDDKVVARTRFRGLHVGPFQGIPPTHRTIEFDQIHIWRLEDGRIAEHWACMDELTGLRQMGAALPQPRTQPATALANCKRGAPQVTNSRNGRTT